jgi:hypothetical protein
LNVCSSARPRAAGRGEYEGGDAACRQPIAGRDRVNYTGHSTPFVTRKLHVYSWQSYQRKSPAATHNRPAGHGCVRGPPLRGCSRSPQRRPPSMPRPRSAPPPRRRTAGELPAGLQGEAHASIGSPLSTILLSSGVTLCISSAAAVLLALVTASALPGRPGTCAFAWKPIISISSGFPRTSRLALRGTQAGDQPHPCRLHQMTGNTGSSGQQRQSSQLRLPSQPISMCHRQDPMPPKMVGG